MEIEDYFICEVIGAENGRDHRAAGVLSLSSKRELCGFRVHPIVLPFLQPLACLDRNVHGGD